MVSWCGEMNFGEGGGEFTPVLHRDTLLLRENGYWFSLDELTIFVLSNNSLNVCVDPIRSVEDKVRPLLRLSFSFFTYQVRSAQI
jgi:hypothetical protein